jgi:hypothetical protein
VRARTRSWLPGAAALALAAAACAGTAGPSDAGSSDATRGDVGDARDGVTDVTVADAVAVPDGTTPSCGTGLGGCDPLAQTGCPPEQACVLARGGDGGASTRCTTPGARVAGEPCAAPEDCSRGLSCLGSGVCTALCCGPGDDGRCRAAPACEPDQTCQLSVAGTALWACGAEGTCDLLRQDCPGTQSCLPTGPAATACGPGGSTPPGAACANQSCQRGSMCVTDASGAGVCRTFCTLDASTGRDGGGAMCVPVLVCGASEVCTRLGTFPGVGICSPP